MQQRRAVTGRPLGTDGFDFNYRMVVDSRYRRVAKGKSRLKFLIAAQDLVTRKTIGTGRGRNGLYEAFSQVIIGSLWVLLSASDKKELNRFVVLSCSIGFISLLIGELGRRRSQGILLRLYTIISSVATTFAVACVVRSDSFVKAIQDKNVSAMPNFELVEVVRVLLGVMLQIFVIITTITLVHNMSPPKRSS